MMSAKEKKERTQARKAYAKKDSTSIRFSQNEREFIQKKASEKGVSASAFVRECVMHGDEALTPYQKMKLQNVVNTAYEVIKDSDPEKAHAMLQEVQGIWMK